MKLLHWVVATTALTLMTACGGGSSGTADPDPLPSVGPITGTATWHDAQHSVRTAPAGTLIKLVSLDSAGNSVATLSQAAVDAQGRYTLSVPSATQPGADLALLLADEDGTTTYRALVLQGGVDVGPASEAFARELLAAPVTWKSLAAGEGERLARLQRAVAQFLGASDPHRSTPEALLSELRARLHADPASEEVFAALRAGANVPNLGDIGALFGLGRAAWMADDSDGTLREWVTQPSAKTLGDYDRTVEYRSQTEWPPRVSVRATFRQERDGVTTVQPDLGFSPAYSAVILSQLLGPLRTFEFGLVPGNTARLNDIHRSTGSYTFDADQAPDTLHYTSDITVLGPQRLDHFGGSVLALKVANVSQLQVDLSSGGSIRVTETRTDWHVPFAGIVRSDSTVTGVDRNGNATTSQGMHKLQAGVTNGVSWPGGVRIEKIAIAWDATDPRYVIPLGLTPQRNLVLYADEDKGVAPGVALVSIDDGRPIATKPLLRAITGTGRVRLSPDGTKLYDVITKVGGFTNYVEAIPADQAASAGTVITRFDTQTLNEEARYTLPAEPSNVIAGMAFPRSTAHEYMVSPLDPNQFLVGSLGTVFYSPDGTPSSHQFSPPRESYGPNRPIPWLITDTIYPLAWDDRSDEVWLRVVPWIIGSASYAVPVENHALQVAKARPLPPFVDEAGQSIGYPRPTDRNRFTDDAVFVGDFDYKFSKADGRLLGRKKYSVGRDIFAGRQNGCDYQQDQVVCVTSASNDHEWLVFMRSSDLSETLAIDLQRGLRSASGQQIELGGGGFYQVSRDEFVFMETFSSEDDVALLRITLN